MPEFGLTGTITADRILYDDGRSFRMLGGILYQAAVLCGLGEGVRAHSHCGEGLRAEVEAVAADWRTLRREGILYVPGAGNCVELRYSEKLKEREEVLRSHVPPFPAEPILADMPQMDMLIGVSNSGFDIRLEDWRRVTAAARCPIWMDVHSLVLEKRVGFHRDYAALPEWRDWVEGVSFLQANRQELACILGHSERWAVRDEIERFAPALFALGVQALFVTMGREGVLALTPRETRMVAAIPAQTVVDTTGCGDVFCAAAARALARGTPVFEACERGVALASAAAGAAGIRETYELALRARLESEVH